MKTAVSIPDALFHDAEAAAKRRGWSRSHLYARALEQLLVDEQPDEITARLDAIFAEEPDPGLDPLFAAAQRRAVAE